NATNSMTEPIFFDHPAGLTVGEIAVLTGAEAPPGTRLDLRVTGVAPLDRAGSNDLSFLDAVRYADLLPATRARGCLTSARFAGRAPARVVVLVVRQPYRAFVAVARKLFEGALRPSSLFAAAGTGAAVHPTARLESGVTLDPGVVIGPGAEIGGGTAIAA